MSDTETEDREDCPVIKKHCNYYCYQCDNNGEVAIEHCGHPDNKDDHEGNCTTKLCPLTPISINYSILTLKAEKYRLKKDICLLQSTMQPNKANLYIHQKHILIAYHDMVDVLDTAIKASDNIDKEIIL